MPLTATQIKNAKPKDKDFSLNDSAGLSLLIKTNGSKLWRYRKTINGKPVLRSLGSYPEVSLAQAREKATEFNKLFAAGVDPLQQEREEAEREGNTFKKVAIEWHGKKLKTWTPDHAKRILRGLETNIFPWLGDNKIDSIKPRELLQSLRRMEERGIHETAHRELSTCGQIFRYGVASGYCERDISADLRGALVPVKHVHHASITKPQEMGELLRSIDAYKGTHIVRCALRLAPLFFVRPGELRHAEWNEFNFEAAEWRIPANKMKSGALHVVPLSTQALDLLQNELQPLTGSGRYLFPGRTSASPMSENTLNKALRSMGYANDTMTSHGFRSMASTNLNEMGWNRDAIERQLAHAERDEVRAAYNYADHLPERRKMMQEWADYLDSLKAGATIIPFQQQVG